MPEFKGDRTMSDINPNIPVNGPETTNQGTIEVRGGETPITFDELDNLTASKKAKSQDSSKKTDESKDDSGKTKGDEKSKDLTSDTDKGKKAKESDKSKDKTDKKPDQATKEEIQRTEAQARKLIKAKYQDKEIELDEESLIPVKINGKEELVEARELLKNYSGKTAWDRKFTELHKVKQDVFGKSQKLSEIEGKIKSVFEEKDPQLRLYKMAEIAGVSPVEFRQKYLDENVALLEKYYNMTDEERKADALAFENAYLKHRAETQEKTLSEQQAIKALQSKVDSLRAPHNISHDDFVERYDALKQLVTNQQLEGEKLTPEFVVETIVKDKLWEAAEEKLSGLSLPWNEKEKSEKLMKLVTQAYTLGMSPESVMDTVEELWGVTAAKNKVAEKRKEQEEFKTGIKPVETKRAPQREALLFDDL